MLGLVCLLVFGCGNSATEERVSAPAAFSACAPFEPREVRIAPELDEDWRAAITAAYLSFEALLGAKRLPLTLVHSAEPPIVKRKADEPRDEDGRCVTTWLAEVPSLPTGHTARANGDGTVSTTPPQVAGLEPKRQIAVHELGHILGLEHNKSEPDSVMAGYLPLVDDRNLTCGDVAALCARWGCELPSRCP